MTIQIYLSEVTVEHDQLLLPDLHEVTGQALWIRLQKTPFEKENIAELARAFGDLKGIVWHASSGGFRSPRIKDYRRAFGDWPKLAKNIVAQYTIQYQNSDDKFYSDIALVSPD